jgi:hypothetical protein
MKILITTIIFIYSLSAFSSDQNIDFTMFNGDSFTKSDIEQLTSKSDQSIDMILLRNGIVIDETDIIDISIDNIQVNPRDIRIIKGILERAGDNSGGG